MTFSHPHFAEPVWLWLAFLGPISLAALQWFSAWRRGQQLEKIAAAPFLEDLTRSRSSWRRGVKHVLLLGSVTAVGLALARPQWGEREEGGQVLGEDIVFVLDCSRSMLAADVLPNRLQRARLAIQDFMTRHTRSRLGLVAFAGQAFLQCPLTFDYSGFEEALQAVDEKTIPIPGTDIGAALDEGFRAMEKGEREKLLVVLTDGEDLEQGGVRTAQTLAKQGVVIYTIGIGTPGGAEIRIFNDLGKPEFVRDLKGEVVRSRLDEATLRQIAQAAHGAYYPLGPLGEGLGKVRVAIETRKSASGVTPARKLGVDRFEVPIAVLLVLLVAESLLGTRKRARALILFLTLFWVPAGVQAVDPEQPPIARLDPVPPCPPLVAAARAGQIPLDQIDPVVDSQALNAGDSITALVTLFEKGSHRTQWLVHMVAVEPETNATASKPPAPIVMYSSLGNRLEFMPAPTRVRARTLGPFLVTQNGKAPKPQDKTAQFTVDKGSLALGLDRAAAAILRLRQTGIKGALSFGGAPFSEAETAKGRKLAETVHLTSEEERAVCGSAPALLTYFSTADQTPGLQDILVRIVDTPSLWSIVRHGGVTANLMFERERFGRANLAQLGLPADQSAYHFPMKLELNGQAVLTLTFVVTNPGSPFLACGGIVALLAENPAEKEEYLTLRVISARRAAMTND